MHTTVATHFSCLDRSCLQNVCNIYNHWPSARVYVQYSTTAHSHLDENTKLIAVEIIPILKLKLKA